jgi:hypothetical protein
MEDGADLSCLEDKLPGQINEKSCCGGSPRVYVTPEGCSACILYGKMKAAGEEGHNERKLQKMGKHPR